MGKIKSKLQGQQEKNDGEVEKLKAVIWIQVMFSPTSIDLGDLVDPRQLHRSCGHYVGVSISSFDIYWANKQNPGV